ncbi:MAG: glycoside hydrolase family 2 TIM barrel-domain containing protein [Mobilitalea sp.]
MERRRLFNDNWEFTKQVVATELPVVNGENIIWSAVDLPHDWLIYNTEDLYEDSEGWYRKTFQMKKVSGQIISICFEGVYMNSTVYVNDVVAGEWKYGYSSFEFDITKLLQVGSNEIKVKAVNQSPNTRWYSGAGIYRNVWLKTTALTHLVTDGIYVHTRKEDNGWYAEIETEVAVQTTGNITIKHMIFDQEELLVANSQNLIEGSNEIVTDSQVVFMKQPILWSTTSPYLYSLKTVIMENEVVLDTFTQKIGYRTLRFDCNEGFFINDRHLKLHGACEHHDLGALGAAMNKTALRRQLELLMDMGVNSVRTSHNMPSVEMMELADEMGILIVSESFDMWERQKTDYDYSHFFPEWHERDVASWVRRDRNHPSIIMWSIGNEIYDTHADARGLEVTKMLRDLVLLHDPKGNGITTIGSNYMPWEGAQKCANELQAAGYNYAERLYQEHHEKYPDWVIYGSETASTVQSRGIYHFPANKVVLTHDDEQCSSLGNCCTGWGAKSTQHNIIDDREAKFCLGQYIWTGFDYIGEPTPYNTKNSYFGHIDTAGFPKDSYYLYQAEWTDYKTNPMVHILPYWDFNEGQMIDIRIYSNAPKTELFVNDKSMGIFEIDHEHGRKLSGEWQVPYQPGFIKAVAYDENNVIIAEDIQSSYSDPSEIILKPNKTIMKADGQDLIFVEISMQDEMGNPVANANNRVEVKVIGAGRLVGLDNGDSTDYDQYKGTSRKLFSGKLIAMIAAKQEAGDILLSVLSEGLSAKEMTLKAVPCERIDGITALMENCKSEPNREVPIRKIELTNHGTCHMNKENRITKLSAKILPANATDQEIVWKAYTVGGIETNIAKVEAEGSEATITVLGDGEFRLRCMAYNGKKTPEIISEYEFDVKGMGKVTLNPYQFVSAGLYNTGSSNLQSGMLGGIAIPDTDHNVLIGFKSLDFGDYGSDEVTIPINYWGTDQVPLELWEGVLGEEGAMLLLATHYQAVQVWNTYTPNTFKLPRRLKGITTFCIAIHTKSDVQGFEFNKIQKAYEKLMIQDNTNIYGDSFTITKDAIEQIGNNVMIDFEDMDFGTKGFEKLIICGKSNSDTNTVHVRFSSEEGNVNQIAEFAYSKDYEEHEFKLDSVKGNQKVSFLFLPGSNFDMKWFRFI